MTPVVIPPLSSNANLFEPFCGLFGSFSRENALKCDNPEDSSEMKRAENEMMQIA